MILVKIGGGEWINIEGIIKGLAIIDEEYIIVHGANVLRDSLAEKLGIEKKNLISASGYSSVYSDEAMIDVMMMSYSGLRNKRIVELCRTNGINAIGLTGLDGGIVSGSRNNGIRVKENGKLRIVRDNSGKPGKVNKQLFDLLLSNGYTPVLTVPISDENGFAVNTENDDVIRVLHNSFYADTILQFIEAPGLLKNNEDNNSAISKMNYYELKQFETEVDGRIKRKLLALRKLLEIKPVKIIISDGRSENPVEEALNGKGTVINE